MHKIKLIVFAGLLSITTVAAQAGVVTVDFDSVDTSGGSVAGSAVNTYLSGFGISLANVTPTTTMYISTPPTADTNVVLTSSPNYFRQWWSGINGTSYDLKFSVILQSLSVTIPQLSPGVLVPSWSLTALDTTSTSLGSFSGGLASSPFPARTFTFTGPIAALRVYSNVFGSAGLGGIPIDDLKLTTVSGPVSTIPEPATLALFGIGLAGLGFAHRRKAA